LGFGLKEIAELVSLGEHSQLSCAAMDDIALRHLKETRHRIAQLDNLAAELEQIIASCQGGRIPECRILVRRSVSDSDQSTTLISLQSDKSASTRGLR